MAKAGRGNSGLPLSFFALYIPFLLAKQEILTIHMIFHI